MLWSTHLNTSEKKQLNYIVNFKGQNALDAFVNFYILYNPYSLYSDKKAKNHRLRL